MGFSGRDMERAGGTPKTGQRGSPWERAGWPLHTSSPRGSPPGTLGAKGPIGLASLWPARFPMCPPQAPCALEHPGIVPTGQTQRLEAGPLRPIPGEAWGENL